MTTRKKDIEWLVEKRSSLIIQWKSCKDADEREKLRKEINDASEMIKNYSASDSARKDALQKWCGIGLQAAGVVLPLWLTNKWSTKWTAMENGELRKNGVALNPPTTKIPNLFRGISGLFKK